MNIKLDLEKKKGRRITSIVSKNLFFATIIHMIGITDLNLLAIFISHGEISRTPSGLYS